MAKLDWGKASLRELDPARVQRTVDFTVPDKVEKTVTLTKKAGPSPAQQRRKEKKAEQQAATHAKHIAKKAKAVEEAAKRAASEATQIERRKAVVARLAAEEARKLSPEYIEVHRAEEARLAWIEHERKVALIAKREPLRQRWRRQLLGR